MSGITRRQLIQSGLAAGALLGVPAAAHVPVASLAGEPRAGTGPGSPPRAGCLSEEARQAAPRSSPRPFAPLKRAL